MSSHVKLVDHGTKLIITLGVNTPNPDVREFVYDEANNSVVDATGEVAFLPNARTLEQFKKRYFRTLEKLIRDNIPSIWPYAHGVGAITVFSQKASSVGAPPKITSQYLWTPRGDMRLISQTRRGYTRSVSKFLTAWFQNAITQMDKITSNGSGQTQLGVVSVELTLTRDNGVNPAGAWTGHTIAKDQFKNPKHGIVDVKPSAKYPEACFLNSILAMSYSGVASRLASHYKVTSSGILQLNTEFFGDNNPLQGADASTLIAGLVGEAEIDEFEEKNPLLKVEIWLLDSETERPILQRSASATDTDTKLTVLLTVPLNDDGSEQIDTSHYVGLRHGISPILSHRDNKAYPCENCGHVYLSEYACARCTCEAPNVTHEFRGGSLKASAAAMADMNDVVVVVDFEAHGTTKQTPFSVGMVAYTPPLIPGGTPRRIDLVDTSKESTEIHTFSSFDKDAVVVHYLKTLDHFQNDFKRRRLQNTRDLASNMSLEEWARFNADVVSCAGVCPGCEKRSSKLVPDHSHNEMTGEPVYREPLCSSCNLKKRVNGNVTILMYNGSGYDWILLQDAMSRCLPNSLCDCEQCNSCDCKYECDCKSRKWSISKVLAKSPQNHLTFTMKTVREVQVPQCEAIIRGGKRCSKPAMRNACTCLSHKDSKTRDASKATVPKLITVGLELKNLDVCNFVGPGSLEKKASERIPNSVELFRRKNGDDTPLPPNLITELRAALPLVSSEFPNDDLFQHATRKGVFPYELETHGGVESWMSRPGLPPIEAFNTSLNGPISSDAYKRAQRVSDSLSACGLPTFGDYHDFYLKVDVLLTAEVSYNCQKTWWDLSRIGIFNFVTLSGAAYAYMVKELANSPEIEGDKKHTHPIELIDNEEVWEIFQQGMSGGFCSVGEARAITNHPALKGYDPELVERILVYIDESSLYPATSSENPMPGRDFKLIKNTQKVWDIVGSLDGRTVEDLREDKIGHILDITIAYCCRAHTAFEVECADCRKVHDKNGVFPCVPHGRNVVWGDLSPLQRAKHTGCKDHSNYCADCDACQRAKRTGCKDHSKYRADCDACQRSDTVMSTRLVADLQRKRISISTISLAYYLSRGLITVVEVHRAVSYTNTWCLKDFFTGLLEKRKAARSSGEKGVIKLIMNAIIGYTMMNKSSHLDIRIDTNIDYTAEELTKRRRVSTYVTDIKMGGLRYWMHTKKIITETLPIQIGVVTYDLSKLLLNRHADRVIDGMHGLEIRKVYTDTDSLVLEMIGKGVSEAWFKFNKENAEMFVLEGYPKWHDMYDADYPKRFCTMEEERPPSAKMGFCLPCQALVRDCMACDTRDRGGENPCGAPCAAHTGLGCTACNELREKYRRVPSTVTQLIAAGSKNYILMDEEGVKVTSRGTMRAQRKRAAEDDAFRIHYETGEGYRVKQPRLAATTIRPHGVRQEKERDAGMELTEPSLSIRVIGVESERVVIPEAGGEKSWMIEEACSAHEHFDPKCKQCRRFYRPFGHYLNTL